MLVLQPIIPIVVSLLVLLVPGLAFVPWPKRLVDTPLFGARVILWSVVFLILSSFVLSALGLPPVLSIVIAVIGSVIWGWRRRASYNKKQLVVLAVFAFVFLAVFVAFSVPFLVFHDGLPTGDSQKSIYWAEYIINNQALPNYGLSFNELNRDPVDFYTPGLHSFTAAVMQAIPVSYELPLSLMAIGYLSISLAMAVSVIALAIGLLVIEKSVRSLLVLLVPFFVLTNYAFLRYLREPGYHYQNIVGELLLFGLLFLVISLLNKKSTADIVLALGVVATLSITHQFSVFLAVFALAPALLLFLLKYKKEIYSYFLVSRYARFALVGVILFVLVVSFSLNLPSKIPHFFTSTPHLLSSVPDIFDYFRIMGATWFLFGLIGLVLFLFRGFRRQLNLSQQAFLLTTIVLLVLSQGPRIFIDIPPIRAMLYLVVPLSIVATYLVIVLWRKVFLVNRRVVRLSLFALIVIGLVYPSYVSVAKAFKLSHQTRTNSSLLSEYLPVISYLENSSGAVLVDDYNRRSSSWMLIGGQPTYSRLSSSIERTMAEMSQSDLRRQMYLRNLDFEKIFSLGSWPEVGALLRKYNIEHVVGIDKSSYAAFSHNPVLQEVTKGGDLTLFQNRTELSLVPNDVSSWLLKPTTLVNDIGDSEDTHKHLPASLSATRLSEPLLNGNTTYRASSAPYIPISFNVNDYVVALWDQDGSGKSDTSLQVMIKTIDGLDLNVRVSENFSLIVSGDGTPVTIPLSHVNLDEDDLVTFLILNPSQRLINIDLIALGLARIP